MALKSPEEFEELQLLGEGAFSETTLVKRKTDDANFVLKRVNLTRILEPKFRQLAKDEATNLTSLHHPNILRIHNHFCEINSAGNLFYHIVVENTDNWTLADEIEKVRKSGGFFSENHILWWSNQLSSALKYLHSKKIMHRNVRPNNIFLVNNNRDVKLGEFGFVKHEEINFDPAKPETLCAMSYLSPEFLAGDHEYCEKCDLWAMGVVLYEAVSHKVPQDHNSPKLGFPPKTSNVYSKELLNFIRWTLTADDDERPTVAEAVKHPLVSENRVDQIRTLFGLPLSSDGRSLRISDEDLEPWHFHGRSSTIRPTAPWISALLEMSTKDYVIVTSYSGEVSAISRSGEKHLWTVKVAAEGARGGIWHAAVDEKRGRLLLCYNGIDEPVNVYPVDIYCVGLDQLEANGEVKEVKDDSEESKIKTVRAELLFHHDDWHCYGLRVDPNADLLYICDWFENHIGIFDLDTLKSGANPIHVITKPEQFKHFNPTRVALIPASPLKAKQVEESVEQPLEQLLAVSDFLRSRIYLFKTISIRNTINHEFEAVITSKGDEIGLVTSPVDLQCDPIARTLIVCDQANSRAQVFIPDPEWPLFKAIATENLGNHPTAVTYTQVHSRVPSTTTASKLTSRRSSEVSAISEAASHMSNVSNALNSPNNAAGSNGSNPGSNSGSNPGSRIGSIGSSPGSDGAIATTNDSKASSHAGSNLGAKPGSNGSNASSPISVGPPSVASSRRNVITSGDTPELDNIRVLMAGLNTGEVASYKYKCG